MKDWHQLQCTLNNRGPLQNASIALSQVRPSEFLCSYETHCFALCMCCDFFACDCRMKCSEGCDCFHDQTWSSNIIECGRRGHARYLLFSKIGYIYYLSKLLVIVHKSKWVLQIEVMAARNSIIYVQFFEIEDTLSNAANEKLRGRVVYTFFSNYSVPEFIPMDATAVYLDGNNFDSKALINDEFIGRKHLTSLYLNNSQIKIISNQTFKGMQIADRL